MSDCFNLYDVNLTDQAVLTPSSVNALFPASNIQDPRRSKVYRSLTNTDNIVLDFGETSEVTTIFIVSDKRSGLGVSTVTVEFNATSNFASPAYTVSVPLSTKFGIGFVTFPLIEYRFARILMTSTLGYCEIANVFIGQAIPLVRSISFGWTIKDEELSQKQRNRYGQVFTDVILRQKSIGCSFGLLDKEDLDTINTALDRVGETKPVYITIGNNTMVVDYLRFSGPVYLDDMPTITNSSFGRYNLSMSLREVT